MSSIILRAVGDDMGASHSEAERFPRTPTIPTPVLLEALRPGDRRARQLAAAR